MTKKKKVEPVEWHQHMDDHGRVFGKSHPAHLDHYKESTQYFHELTIGTIVNKFKDGGKPHSV